MPRVCSTLTITNTTAQNILPAVAKVINLVKSIQFQSTNSTSTTFNLLVGATVVATFRTPANMVPASVSFDYPLVSDANQAIQVQATTTGGNVLFNFQGETVLKI